MRGMPFNLQGKGVIEVAAVAGGGVAVEHNSILWSRSKKEGVEPRSVLDHRRSPSPPTSTSTLSSSLGGGGGSTDSAGVAAVSDNPPQKWPPSQDTSSAAVAAAAQEEGGGGGRKEEWASELQPIALEIGLMGGEKCGLGVEDWETMLSETPAVAGSPGQDQSFLRWIMGDVDDPSSMGPKQQQQMLSQGAITVPGDFDIGSGGGFGLIDPGFGFEAIGGIGGGVSASAVGPPLAASCSLASGGGFPLLSSNNGSSNGGNRILPIPTSSALPNIKVPFFGNNQNPIFPAQQSPAVNSLQLPLSLPPAMFYQEPMEEKPQLFSPNLLLNHQQSQSPQNQSFFLPLPPFSQPDHHQQQLLLPPQAKRQHSMGDPTCQISPKVPFSDSGQDLFLRRHQPQQQQQSFGSLQAQSFHNLQQRSMKPKLAGDEASAAAAAHHQQQQQQQQALIDQLFKAAELIEAGNSVNARGILARLNHQLSPHGKPLLRSAFYFKEALNAIVTNNYPNMPPSSAPPPQPRPPATPVDVVLKLNAYKTFSEISPVLQFANFTCIQALLEELSGCDRIHIVDFDIGVGGQWSSFMQELSQRRCSGTAATISLKITAFVSPSSHHPLELVLTKENLTHFARDLNIPFEFNILNIDSFDPVVLLNMSGCDEAIAVNIPVGSSYTSTPTLLRLVKQLSPKIVVSVDHDCDRSNLSFSQHFLNALNSYTLLLESIDAAGTNMEVANKIERFLLQPRIESAVLGRYRTADKMLPWRTIFASAGFVQVPFSNFTETQAECLLKRIQVREFHVQKRQSSLLLFWQRGELVSVSAWRC